MATTNFDLKTLWIDYIVWYGGMGAITLGLIGATLAVILRATGYRHVRRVPDQPGWGAGFEVGAPPSALIWFGTWSSLGGIIGAVVGFVFYLHDLG